MSKQEVNFDEAMGQLELIIKKLEAGNLPLEESIELYKEGMSLSGVCHSKLQKIEAEVVKLVDAAGDMSDFNNNGE